MGTFIGYWLWGAHVRSLDLGRLSINDSVVQTRRDPDTVRGADVCYFSCERLPKGPIPEGVLSVVPELFVEVRSPSDRHTAIVDKAQEYLDAGVLVVCVIDPQAETLTIDRQEQPPQTLTLEDELSLPELFGDWRVRVGEFFDLPFTRAGDPTTRSR